MSLPARVLRTVRKHDLFPRGARVLVALSGGPDSVALLHILRTLEVRGELTVAGAAHFNHQLRGQADQDEQFCRALAAGLPLPLEVDRANVAGFARVHRRSVEDAARSLRYAFLHRAADALEADVIATGHSRDDQAETFLLRLIRGSGPRGLAGIRPKAGRVVRPLLEVGRAELRAYAGEHRLAFREDASNADTRIPRNRIRHELIPHLDTYSPAVVRVLARAASVARQDEEYLEARAIDSARAVVLQGEGTVAIEADALRGLPRALSSRIVRHALAQLLPDRDLGYQHLEAVLALSGAPDGGSWSLPGVRAVKRNGRIIIGAAPAQVPFRNFGRFSLSVPGEVTFAGWAVSAALAGGGGERPGAPARGRTAVIAAGPVRQPLAVRARRPGDRFRPLGMGGRGRKLQDYLVDRKVAREERDSLPLVVDSEDRIVWVVGGSVAEDFRVTAPEQAVIVLKARRLGGLG